jgi:hypothetical protein
MRITRLKKWVRAFYMKIETILISESFNQYKFGTFCHTMPQFIALMYLMPSEALRRLTRICGSPNESNDNRSKQIIEGKVKTSNGNTFESRNFEKTREGSKFMQNWPEHLIC